MYAISVLIGFFFLWLSKLENPAEKSSQELNGIYFIKKIKKYIIFLKK
jgi:hypothetical protein